MPSLDKARRGNNDNALPKKRCTRGLTPEDSARRVERDTALWKDVIAKAQLKFGN